LLEHASKKPLRQEISRPPTRICAPLAIAGHPLSKYFRRDLSVPGVLSAIRKLPFVNVAAFSEFGHPHNLLRQNQ
jgi:hypothetical protein